MNRPSSSFSGLHSLPRVLSKMGLCSRTQAEVFISEGRVRVNGKTTTNAKLRVHLTRDRITVDEVKVKAKAPIYIMLNKPTGLVTSRSDESGRPTVYQCFEGAGLPHLPAIGRLDRASEGLLLFSNDNRFSSFLIDPKNHVDKVYRVQVRPVPSEELLRAMKTGIEDKGEQLAVKEVTLFKEGEKSCWLDIVLTEGRNRHIRRLCERLELTVLRLMRIRIGKLTLGNLSKGSWRHLTQEEITILSHR